MTNLEQHANVGEKCTNINIRYYKKCVRNVTSGVKFVVVVVVVVVFPFLFHLIFMSLLYKII